MKPCQWERPGTCQSIGVAFYCKLEEGHEPVALTLGHPFTECGEPDYGGGCRNSGCHYRKDGGAPCGQPLSAHGYAHSEEPLGPEGKTKGAWAEVRVIGGCTRAEWLEWFDTYLAKCQPGTRADVAALVAAAFGGSHE